MQTKKALIKKREVDCHLHWGCFDSRTHQILVVVDCYIDSEGDGSDGDDRKHEYSDRECPPLENHRVCDGIAGGVLVTVLLNSSMKTCFTEP